jgi:hypothetical protein
MDIKDMLIIILPVIGYLAASFNSEYDKYANAREKYFTDFLTIFYDAYRKDKDMNVRYFMKVNYNYSLYYVPPYISYLLERNRIEEIRKVLLSDYYDLMPSYKNIILNTMSRLFNLGDFFVFILMFIASIAIATFTVTLLGLLGFTNQQIDTVSLIMLVGSIIVFALVLIRTIKSILENNLYTFSESQMERMISKKSSCYNKLLKEMLLIK